MKTIVKIYLCLFCIITFIQLSKAQLSTTLPLVVSGQDYTIATTDTFSIEGVLFTPNDSIYVRWLTGFQIFLIYGDASAHISGSLVPVTFGTLGNPSLILETDTTTLSLELLVTDTFKLKALPFVPIPDSTNFRYDLQNAQFEISGYANAILNNKHYPIDLGTNASPGVIYKNNALQRVVAHFHDHLDMHGLASTNTSIILSWFIGHPANTYYGHGDVSIKIDAGYYHAFIGNNTTHGITVVNGKITDVDMVVVGGAILFGFLPTYDSFKFSYDKSKSKWIILGDVTIGLPLGSLLNIPTVKLQTGTTGGIVYHTNTHTFNVDSASFSIVAPKTANISIGGFALLNLKISIHNNIPVGLSGLVYCPPGFVVGADIQFTYQPSNQSLPFFIHSLALEWEAQTMETAIPVGDTGFSIVKISGSLDNLDKPSQLTFADTLGLVFGELITIPIPLLGTKTVAPAYFQADAVLSPQSLKMSVSGDFGATLITNEWQGLLGGNTGTLDLEFGKSYSFTGTMRMPSDPLVTASGTLKFSNTGDFDLLAKCQLVVPHYIPIIGGKTLASVDGALRLKNEDSHNSFAAGWTKLNLGFDHVHVGALFNIGTHNIKKIGAAGASNIESTIENDPVNVPTGTPPPNYYLCSVHHDFTVNGNKPAAYLQNHLKILNDDKFIDPNPNDGDNNIYVKARILSTDPNYPNLESYRPADSYNVFPVSSGLAIDNAGIITMKTNIIDSVAWISANHGVDIYDVIHWQTQPELFLTPGTHTMILQGYCHLNQFLDETDFSFTTSPSYPKPTINFTIDPYHNGKIVYSNYLTDSTDITIFWSPDTTKNGYLINRWPYFWGLPIASMPGFREIDLAFLASALPTLPYDSVYFYTVVNDYVNPPQYSASVPFSLDNFREISGHIKLANGAPAVNVPVILSRADVSNSQVTTHTDANGDYAFFNSPHNDDVVIQVPAPAGHYFTTNMFVSQDFESRQLQAADWLELTLHTGNQDNITANFEVVDHPVALYGAVYDTGYVSIPGTWVFVINESGTVVAQQQTTESGFVFFNLPNGKLKLSMTLPTDENGYHWLTPDITDGASIKERIDSFTYNGVPVKLDYNAKSGFGPFFHFYEAGTNKNLSGGKLELINASDPGNTLFSIQSHANGLVSFDEQDLIPGQQYNVIVTPPSGYHCQNNNCLMTFTWDGFYQEFIPLPMTKN